MHPKLIDSIPDDNWVLTIAEYMPSSQHTYTGFIRYQFDKEYESF